MRNDRDDSGRPSFLWLLPLALLAPGLLVLLRGAETPQPAPAPVPIATGDALPLAAREASFGAGGADPERAALRAVLEEEGARLAAFRAAHHAVAASLEELRTEVSALELRRDQLRREIGDAAAPRGPAPAALPSAAVAPPMPAALADPAPPPTPVAATAASRPPVAQGSAAPLPEVRILHRAGSAPARRAAGQVAGELRRAGFSTVELRETRTPPRTRTLRYAEAEEAPLGQATAARLGARWPHRWTVQASAEAAPGRMEIWLPH